jgi:hypothetical protein
MSDVINFQGNWAAYINLLASLYWTVFAIFCLIRGKVYLGVKLKIEKAENKRLFFGLIAVSVAFSIWTGVAGLLKFLG